MPKDRKQIILQRLAKLLEEKDLIKKDGKDLIIYKFDEFRQLFS